MDLYHARACAHLSSMVYHNQDSVEQELSIFYPTHVRKFVVADGCEVLCLASDTETTIVFRGTEFSTTNDLLANLDAIRERDDVLGDVYVHAGYLEELTSAWPAINDFVQHYSKPNYHRIRVTGHSLGGALALLCSAHLVQLFDLLDVQCYSFGAPMVGGNSFYEHVRMLNFDHWRFVNNNDMVPRLKSLHFLGYRHVGTKFYFDHTHTLLARKQSRWERFKDWVYGHWDAVRSGKLGDSFRDHYIASYIACLDRYE
jgi:triacylglycerol lipase